MSDKRFFAYSPVDRALFIKGVDADDLPEYLQNVPMFRVTGKTTGEFLYVPVEVQQNWILDYLCVQCKGTKYRMPAGWKRMSAFCGNLECALGMTGSSSCPAWDVADEKRPSAYRAMRATVSDYEYVRNELVADGFREFNGVLLAQACWSETSDTYWASEIAKAMREGDAKKWSRSITQVKDTLILDYDRLDELEKCVISAMDKSQSGESAEDWGEEW